MDESFKIITSNQIFMLVRCCLEWAVCPPYACTSISYGMSRNLLESYIFRPAVYAETYSLYITHRDRGNAYKKVGKYLCTHGKTSAGVTFQPLFHPFAPLLCSLSISSDILLSWVICPSPSWCHRASRSSLLFSDTCSAEERQTNMHFLCVFCVREKGSLGREIICAASLSLILKVNYKNRQIIKPCDHFPMRMLG